MWEATKSRIDKGVATPCYTPKKLEQAIDTIKKRNALAPKSLIPVTPILPAKPAFPAKLPPPVNSSSPLRIRTTNLDQPVALQGQHRAPKVAIPSAISSQTAAQFDDSSDSDVPLVSRILKRSRGTNLGAQTPKGRNRSPTPDDSTSQDELPIAKRRKDAGLAMSRTQQAHSLSLAVQDRTAPKKDAPKPPVKITPQSAPREKAEEQAAIIGMSI